MAIKFKAASKNEIPPELQGHYVERDGAFVLDVEGAAEKAKLDEFRANNLELTRQLEDLSKRFEGIDPEEVHKLTEEKRKLEEAQQLKAGEIEKVVEGRMRDVRTDLEKRIRSVAAERDSLHGRLTAIQIDQGVTTAATKKGLRPTAIPCRCRSSLFKPEASPPSLPLRLSLRHRLPIAERHKDVVLPSTILPFPLPHLLASHFFAIIPPPAPSTLS